MRLWTGIQGGRTYWSSTSALAQTTPTLCPSCRQPVLKVQEGDRNDAGELVTWEARHPCGARLMIYISPKEEMA